jgi:hypothetical protein
MPHRYMRKLAPQREQVKNFSEQVKLTHTTRLNKNYNGQPVFCQNFIFFGLAPYDS